MINRLNQGRIDSALKMAGELSKDAYTWLNKYFFLRGMSPFTFEELSKLRIPPQIFNQIVQSLFSIIEFPFTGSFELTVPEGVRVLENETLKKLFHCSKLNLPSTLESFGTPGFYAYSYELKDLRELSLPESCTYMEMGLIFPTLEKFEARGLEYIPENVFNRSRNLEFCSINDTCTNIPDLRKTRIKSFTIPSACHEIKASTFNSCTKLESIVIPDNIRYIHSCAFAMCTNLSSVEISKTSKLKVISSQAFAYTNIKRIWLPPTVETIEDSAFLGCESVCDIELSRNTPLPSVLESERIKRY